MEFQVRLSRQAEIEIEAAYQWFKERTPDYADQWFRDLMNRMATLQKQPRRCALAIENDVFPEEIRQLLYGKKQPNIYRILFVIRDDVVYVLHVRHCRQPPLTAEDVDNQV